MRTILLKLECKGASGGCCGKGGRKPTNKYGLLKIEESKTPTPIPVDMGEVTTAKSEYWNLIEASPLYGNIMTMAQKHATEKPAWAGTVLTLGLDKDPDFMAQLNALKIIKKGCVIAE